MSIKSRKIDFIGQDIFVGIDIHKKHFTVTIQGALLVYKTFNQPPESNPLVNYLIKHFPNANYFAAYEAGFCGFWLCKELLSQGINCIVVNPADVPSTDKEKKQKRDKLDSRKLARALKNGELKAIHVPEIQIQQDRGLLRTRKQFVGNQTRCRNRIKSLLDFYGIQIPEKFNQSGSHWSNKFMIWLETDRFSREKRNRIPETVTSRSQVDTIIVITSSKSHQRIVLSAEISTRSEITTFRAWGGNVNGHVNTH